TKERGTRSRRKAPSDIIVRQRSVTSSDSNISNKNSQQSPTIRFRFQISRAHLTGSRHRWVEHEGAFIEQVSDVCWVARGCWNFKTRHEFILEAGQISTHRFSRRWRGSFFDGLIMQTSPGKGRFIDGFAVCCIASFHSVFLGLINQVSMSVMDSYLVWCSQP
ncbi:hypothetical protein CCUS01_04536, partial [Colletotrichum cuscutae]